MTAPSPRHTLPAQRRQAILRAVRSGSSHVSDLAQSFGVSEMTVRRDLHALASEGKLERVRGGAVSSGVEPPFEQTAVERFDAKDRIGLAAAAMVEDGQTVMIDIGTSTLQSRAFAGLANATFVFCLPGSTSACRLAWDKIIAQQLDARTRPCNLAALRPRLAER